jgi:hypothetical protein
MKARPDINAEGNGAGRGVRSCDFRVSGGETQGESPDRDGRSGLVFTGKIGPGQAGEK